MAQSMQHQVDRRVTGVRRVPVERIVDVCATSASPASAFQGWSVNVSGRGMSVRATHVPELNAPVVVRFQEHGAEVIAEGEVVWRKETPAGSEFGVRFTALDSRSVQALKELCQAVTLRSAIELPDLPEDNDTEQVPSVVSSSVKLHIEGLAAPMQAQVRQQGQRRVALGSQLDFLRVGRNVQVEDGPAGAKRGARIDSVNVAVDPESHVPELIVSLSYDPSRTPPPVSVRTTSSAPPPASVRTASSAPPPAAAPAPRGVTPKPSIRIATSASVHSARVASALTPRTPASSRVPSAPAPRVESVPAELVERVAQVFDAPEQPDEDEVAEVSLGAPLDEPDPDADEIDSLFGSSLDEQPPPRPSLVDARNARSAAAKDDLDEELPSSRPSLEIEDSAGMTSEAERLRQRLDGMLDGLSSVARVASERCRRLSSAASQGAVVMARRAQTAGRRVLATRAAALPRRRTAAPPRSLRNLGAHTTPRSLVPAGGEAPSRRRVPPPVLLGGALVALVAGGSWLAVGRGAASASRVAEPAAPAAQTAPARPHDAVPAAPEVSPPSPRSKILAPPENVEPEDVAEPSAAVAQVPLFGPTSLTPPSVPTREASAAARVPVEQRAMARYKVAEDAFGSPPPRAPARSKAPPAPPAEVRSGRLHLPVVYRLRLDSVGTALRGERTATGFDVIVPGRKTMESGSAITRRDHRIAKVTTRNGSDGARVSFKFRNSVPAYKVRLRKDYVEFFISSD